MPALAYFGQTIVDFFRPALKTAAAELIPLEPLSTSNAGSPPDAESVRCAASAK